MSKHRTVVSMIVEWDSNATSDPRKWDWNAIVSDDGDAMVTHVGTRRLPEAMTPHDDDCLMRGIDDATVQAIEEVDAFATTGHDADDTTLDGFDPDSDL
jgi:hypothetical protein